jgi:hypothetical protein
MVTPAPAPRDTFQVRFVDARVVTQFTDAYNNFVAFVSFLLLAIGAEIASALSLVGGIQNPAPADIILIASTGISVGLAIPTAIEWRRVQALRFRINTSDDDGFAHRYAYPTEAAPPTPVVITTPTPGAVETGTT